MADPDYRFGLLNTNSVLPQNDRGVMDDREFTASSASVIERSKQLYFWQSVSRVANMIAAVMIPGVIALVTGGLIHNGTLTSSMLTAVSVLGGVAATALTVGVTTDYWENLIRRRQDFDTNDLSAKRQATHMARAFDELGEEKQARKTTHAAALQKLQGLSWEDKSACDSPSQSQSIH